VKHVAGESPKKTSLDGGHRGSLPKTSMDRVSNTVLTEEGLMAAVPADGAVSDDATGEELSPGEDRGDIRESPVMATEGETTVSHTPIMCSSDNRQWCSRGYTRVYAVYLVLQKL
jgi:hypothetical protein